jgi:hypothetical protein
MSTTYSAIDYFEHIIPIVCKQLYSEIESVLEQISISSDDRFKFYQYMYLLKYTEKYYANDQRELDDETLTKIFNDLNEMFRVNITKYNPSITISDKLFQTFRTSAENNRKALGTMLAYRSGLVPWL